jgi:hypothetical protein
MTNPDLLNKLARDLGGKIEEVGRLPDGSGFATMSIPLPRDHWSTANPDAPNVPPMPFRMGQDDPRSHDFAQKVRAAARYAYRSATINGKEEMDPDALLQNLLVGLFGYNTSDGLSQMGEPGFVVHPDPIPPPFPATIDRALALRLVLLVERLIVAREIDHGSKVNGIIVALAAQGDEDVLLCDAVREAIGEYRFDEDACPGHVASARDPRVCGRCGASVESMRPD